MGFRCFSMVSAKGGVGKTTLCAAFARSLPGSVALVDGDYGNPVLHLALGINHSRHLSHKSKIFPVPWDKGELASLALLTVPGGILRQSGEYRVALIEDFLASIAWKPYRYMLVDTAPSLSQENEAIIRVLDPEVILVSEPGPLAQEGVVRTVLFLNTIRAKLLGLVGNKGFEGQELAKELDIPYLGTVPLVALPDRIETPDFARFTSERLGKPTWADRLRRKAARLGLVMVLEEEP